MAGTRAGAQKRRQNKLTEVATVMQTAVAKEVYLDRKLEAGYPVYVVGPKRALMHEGKRLEAGEPVPGAHLWPRLESWLNTGRIVKA